MAKRIRTIPTDLDDSYHDAMQQRVSRCLFLFGMYACFVETIFRYRIIQLSQHVMCQERFDLIGATNTPSSYIHVSMSNNTHISNNFPISFHVTCNINMIFSQRWNSLESFGIVREEESQDLSFVDYFIMNNKVVI